MTRSDTPGPPPGQPLPAAGGSSEWRRRRTSPQGGGEQAPRFADIRAGRVDLVETCRRYLRETAA